MAPQIGAQSPEQDAKNDAKSLLHGYNSNDKKEERDALHHIHQDVQRLQHQGGSAAVQAYWDTLGKETAGIHLPELQINYGGDLTRAHVISVRDQNGHRLFDGGLHRDQGPYQDFIRQGMTPEEAKKAAHTVKEVTGRTEYKQGETFTINDDGTVTSHVEDRDRPGSWKNTSYEHGKIVQTLDATYNPLTEKTYLECRDGAGKLVSNAIGTYTYGVDKNNKPAAWFTIKRP